MMNLKIVEKDDRYRSRGGLTQDQELAAGRILDFIAADFSTSKYVIGLAGPGGVGKTFTINYIINNCKYSRSVIKCATPSHKACRVLSEAMNGYPVETIQSVFGFQLNLKLENFNPHKPQFSPMGKTKLDGIRVLVIDESSMIPAKVVTYILNKCKELQIKVIFTGDDYQLSPVNERRSTAFLVCSGMFYLNQMVRQGADNPVNHLLILLRNDIKNRTYTFLEYINKRIGTRNYNSLGEGYAILNPACFKESVDNSFRNEEYTRNIDMYRIIAYTNPCVNSWNNYIRNTIIADASKHIITRNDLIMSYETIVDEFMDPILHNSEEYIVHDIVDFVDEDYKFKGFLVKFQLVHGGTITRPLFVIDHRDKFTIGYYYQVVETLIGNAKRAGSNSSSKWKEYYDFKRKYILATNITDHEGNVLHPRDIDYGFSLTAHKSQGSTYKNVFVNVNNIVYDKYGRPYNNQDDLLRRLYVGCSRTKHELILHYGL